MTLRSQPNETPKKSLEEKLQAILENKDFFDALRPDEKGCLRNILKVIEGKKGRVISEGQMKVLEEAWEKHQVFTAAPQVTLPTPKETTNKDLQEEASGNRNILKDILSNNLGKLSAVIAVLVISGVIIAMATRKPVIPKGKSTPPKPQSPKPQPDSKPKPAAPKPMLPRAAATPTQHPQGTERGRMTYQGLEQTWMREEQQMNWIIENVIEGSILRDLKKIKSDNKQLQEVIDGVIGIIEATSKLETKNQYTLYLQQLRALPQKTVEDEQGWLVELNDESLWKTKPPLVRYRYLHPRSVNYGSYNARQGILKLKRGHRYDAPASRSIVIHEFVHVWQRLNNMRRKSAQQERQYEQNTMMMMSLNKLNFYSPDAEIDATAASILIADLIEGGKIRDLIQNKLDPRTKAIDATNPETIQFIQHFFSGVDFNYILPFADHLFSNPATYPNTPIAFNRFVNENWGRGAKIPLKYDDIWDSSREQLLRKAGCPPEKIPGIIKGLSKKPTKKRKVGKNGKPLPRVQGRKRPIRKNNRR